MSGFQSSGFGALPMVVKNLLIINGLMFLGAMVLDGSGSNFMVKMALFYPDSPHFSPYQMVTHMFMHGGFGHLFFNMFALFMFGSPLERIWGPKRFLIFYMVTGLGAALLHSGVLALEVNGIAGQMFGNAERTDLDPSQIGALVDIYNTPTVGASGAVFGLLLGFGMLFPNTELMLLFFPVPIKAKYFVILYGAAELFFGVARIQGDNIAHFAHLGGMLFGYLLIKFWQKDRQQFY